LSHCGIEIVVAGGLAPKFLALSVPSRRLVRRGQDCRQLSGFVQKRRELSRRIVHGVIQQSQPAPAFFHLFQCDRDFRSEIRVRTREHRAAIIRRGSGRRPAELKDGIPPLQHFQERPAEGPHGHDPGINSSSEFPSRHPTRCCTKPASRSRRATLRPMAINATSPHCARGKN
jgi:hypothetical protein